MTLTLDDQIIDLDQQPQEIQQLAKMLFEAEADLNKHQFEVTKSLLLVQTLRTKLTNDLKANLDGATTKPN